MKSGFSLAALWRTAQYGWRLSERPYDIDERRTLSEENCLKENILFKEEKIFYLREGRKIFSFIKKKIFTKGKENIFV